MTEKQRLRKLFLERRNKMLKEEVQEKSKKIYNNVISSSVYKKAKSIFIYVSMGNEVDTKDIINKALKDGKIVAVPKVYSKRKEMIFSKITSLDELELGHFNVLEPKNESINPLTSDEYTIIIVPGIVFDKNNNRIGYGGGYYDRYLSSVKTSLKIIGVCYDFQIIDKIPVDYYDISLDSIITDDINLKNL
ncbi:5-formyltetrahydrofolate cyclo-ligase [Defluviitalea phaphyphila]|uniref:5-formyltetrahydrofolate cyclo-ligase n=1 Tax=Defluviitalea phaphyphila TaxID=1473580 RepID=UPI00072FFEA8|nr:5-formyltetrahydrofolate cyclo-ligase [Defluviitalea phaphyphila]